MCCGTLQRCVGPSSSARHPYPASMAVATFAQTSNLPSKTGNRNFVMPASLSECEVKRRVIFRAQEIKD
jgi:hypothetical protein